MCGRYLTKDQRALEREYFLDIRRWPEWRGSYNIAPSQSAPVVVADEDGYVCELMRFGLIPFFAHGEPGKYSTINARMETMTTLASYRGPWKRAQRCLVLASGFYEWQVQADGKSKVPYVIRLADQDSFAMAGLWDASTRADGLVVRSFTIVTLPASPRMAEIHNDKRREPALLPRAACESWLRGTADEALALIRPYPDEQLIAHPVSRRVNSPANNDASLIDPAGPAARSPEPD